MPLRRLPLVRRAVDDAGVEVLLASDRPQPERPPEHVRVVSWNIHLGRRLAGVNALLRGSANLATADVLALQEVSRTRRRNQARILASEMRFNGVYAGAHRCGLGEERGQAILTPYPILRSWRIALPQVRHPRIALAADLDIGGEVLRVVNVHLENRSRVNPFILTRRAEQLTHVLDWLESAGHARTILLGDLNTLGFIVDRGRSEVLPAMLAAAGFTDAHRGDTRSTHRPLGSRLDWIFARHATPVRGAIEDTGRVSDHLALWADVQLDSIPVAS